MRISIFIIILAVLGCRDVEDPVDIGYDYFPLGVGYEWVYQIDSIDYDDFTTSRPADTFTYYRKEVITGETDMPSAETRYNADVFFKTDSTDWSYVYSMVMYKNDVRAVRSIGNKSVMHLLFPVTDRVYWDANQLNSEGTERFRYIDTEKHRSIMKDSFMNNVFVQQAFDTTIIDEDIRWELYAEGVGLVEKQEISLEKQFGDRDGFDYRWKLQSFTKK